MTLESDRGVPTSTSHLTLVSRVWPLGEGPGGCSDLRVWQRAGPELTLLGPPAEFQPGAGGGEARE